MITEIATLKVAPDQAKPFEHAVAAARDHFLASPDCLSFRLDQVIETPGSYLLIVCWTSVEAHMDDFRQTAHFQKWRNLAGRFFIERPHVVHTRAVLT